MRPQTINPRDHASRRAARRALPSALTATIVALTLATLGCGDDFYFDTDTDGGLGTESGGTNGGGTSAGPPAMECPGGADVVLDGGDATQYHSRTVSLVYNSEFDVAETAERFSVQIPADLDGLSITVTRGGDKTGIGVFYLNDAELSDAPLGAPDPALSFGFPYNGSSACIRTLRSPR